MSLGVQRHIFHFTNNVQSFVFCVQLLMQKSDLQGEYGYGLDVLLVGSLGGYFLQYSCPVQFQYSKIKRP